MANGSTWWRVIALALRRLGDENPTGAQALRRRAARIDDALARIGEADRHIVPEIAAYMVGISANRMRRLCQENEGVIGYRISPGRWGVFPGWLADELGRRGSPVRARLRPFAHVSASSTHT